MGLEIKDNIALELKEFLSKRYKFSRNSHNQVMVDGVINSDFVPVI